MSCPNYKKLCKRLVISESVTFAGDTLRIKIPEGNYNDCEKYCIVVAQTIPAATTVAANVVITIGDGTTEYPLLNSDCTNVLACSINARTRYSVMVNTNIQDGVFKLLGRLPCSRCISNAASLPITETAGA